VPDTRNRPPIDALGPAALVAHGLIGRPWFRRAVLWLIILASLVVGIETYPAAMSRYGEALRLIDKVIIALFVVEITLRLLAYGRYWPRFFLDPWNVFDFVIVAVCLVPINSQAAAALRLVRVLRALRLLTAIPQLQIVIGALLRSLPSIGYVGLLLVLLFYVYAVVGTTLFGKNDPAHFGTLHDAALSLLRAVTLEDWTDLYYVQSLGSAEYPPPGLDRYPDAEPQPMPVVAALYFVSFVIIGTMIVLNLFIGVVISSMTEAQAENARAMLEQRGEGEDLGAQLAAMERRMQEMTEHMAALRSAVERDGGGRPRM